MEKPVSLIVDEDSGVASKVPPNTVAISEKSSNESNPVLLQLSPNVQDLLGK